MVYFKLLLKIKELDQRIKLLLLMIQEDFQKKKLNKCLEKLKNSQNKIKQPKKELMLKTLSKVIFIQ